MAYREPLTDTRVLEVCGTPLMVEAVGQALIDGRTVELEFTSFNDPGPDETRIIIDGVKLFTIPGY